MEFTASLQTLTRILIFLCTVFIWGINISYAQYSQENLADALKKCQENSTLSSTIGMQFAVYANLLSSEPYGTEYALASGKVANELACVAAQADATDKNLTLGTSDTFIKRFSNFISKKNGDTWTTTDYASSTGVYDDIVNAASKIVYTNIKYKGNNVHATSFTISLVCDATSITRCVPSASTYCKYAKNNTNSNNNVSCYNIKRRLTLQNSAKTNNEKFYSVEGNQTYVNKNVTTLFSMQAMQDIQALYNYSILNSFDTNTGSINVDSVAMLNKPKGLTFNVATSASTDVLQDLYADSYSWSGYPTEDISKYECDAQINMNVDPLTLYNGGSPIIVEGEGNGICVVGINQNQLLGNGYYIKASTTASNATTYTIQDLGPTNTTVSINQETVNVAYETITYDKKLITNYATSATGRAIATDTCASNSRIIVRQAPNWQVLKNFDSIYDTPIGVIARDTISQNGSDISACYNLTNSQPYTGFMSYHKVCLQPYCSNVVITAKDGTQITVKPIKENDYTMYNGNTAWLADQQASSNVSIEADGVLCNANATMLATVATCMDLCGAELNQQNSYDTCGDIAQTAQLALQQLVEQNHYEEIITNITQGILNNFNRKLQSNTSMIINKIKNYAKFLNLITMCKELSPKYIFEAVSTSITVPVDRIQTNPATIVGQRAIITGNSSELQNTIHTYNETGGVYNGSCYYNIENIGSKSATIVINGATYQVSSNIANIKNEVMYNFELSSLRQLQYDGTINSKELSLGSLGAIIGSSFAGLAAAVTNAYKYTVEVNIYQYCIKRISKKMCIILAVVSACVVHTISTFVGLTPVALGLIQEIKSSQYRPELAIPNYVDINTINGLIIQRDITFTYFIMEYNPQYAVGVYVILSITAFCWMMFLFLSSTRLLLNINGWIEEARIALAIRKLVGASP